MLTIALRQALTILVAAAALCTITNTFRPNPLPWIEIRSAQRLAAIPIEVQVSPDVALALLGRPDVLFVDARPAEDFAAGHIPGALSFPFDPFADDLDTRIATLPQNKTLVIYCGDVLCGLSEELADTLRISGFDQVKVLAEGIDGWKLAGGSLEVTP